MGISATEVGVDSASDRLANQIADMSARLTEDELSKIAAGLDDLTVIVDEVQVAYDAREEEDELEDEDED